MKNKTKEIVAGYLYILPSTLLIIVFSIIPIGMVLYFSFTKYNIIQAAQWVGLANYKRLISDGFISAGIENTLLYTVIVVPGQTLVSLIFAEIIAGFFRNRFGALVKSALFIPVISSSVLIGTIWMFLLTTDGGIINAFLNFLMLPKVNWLGSSKTALGSIAIASIWKNVGYFLVIFYAGIMDVPLSLYEAARVDGATRMQQFFMITVPMLRPIITLIVVLGTIWSFQVFDMVYIMTGGGPGRSTVTLVLSIYQSAFKEYSMGYASAIAVLLFAIVLVISGVQKFMLQNREKSGASV